MRKASETAAKVGATPQRSSDVSPDLIMKHMPWDSKAAVAVEDNALQRSIDQVYYSREQERLSVKKDVASLVLDVSGVMGDGAAAVVDDSFWRCFEHNHPDPMNWNFYLLPMWALGVVVRYLVLFPLRLVGLLVAWAVFLPCFFAVELALRDGPRKSAIQRNLVWASFPPPRTTAHAPRPRDLPGSAVPVPRPPPSDHA